MSAPTFTHSGGDDHVLVYTSAKGSTINIIAAHITDFAPILDNLLIVQTLSSSHHLKFDSAADRDAAAIIVTASLKTTYINLTINERSS